MTDLVSRPLPIRALADLNDVTITSIADGEIIVWDSGSSLYINNTLAEAGIAAASHTHTASEVTDFNTAADARIAAAAISDLANVNAGSPSDGQVLTWDSGTSQWVNENPSGGGATELDDLTDVNAAAPSDGDVLTWDNGTSQWIPEAPAGGGASDLDDLTDVTITAAASGDFLRYSGSAWVDSTIQNTDVPVVPYQAHNLAVNSGFWFASMRKAASTATSYSDDTYGMDCWNILSQGATALVSQQAGTNGLYAMRVQNNTGSSNRIGCCQIIENADTIPLRGQTATFKMRIKCSETKNLRVAIISVIGTADVVTSDCVASWTSTTFTLSNFYTGYGVGATVATAQIACTANTWRDAVVSGTIAATSANIILVVTCDDTLADGEKFDLEEVEFYLGSEVTTARPRMPFAVERLRAARFAYDFQGQQYLEGWKANSSQIYGLDIEFPVPMRAEPTGVVTTTPTFNNGAAGASQVASYNRTGAAYTTITGALTMTATSSAVDRGRIYLGAGTSFSGTNGDFQAIDFGSDFHAYFHAFL